MTKGEKIKYNRKLANLSQTELADKLQVTKQTIFKYEKDIITNIPSDRIELLCLALNITPEVLLGWNDKTKEVIEDNNILELYNILDIEDRAEIRGIIKQMLKSEKYI